MIPLYGLAAGSGKIFSLDDPSVVRDGAAIDGTGGAAYVPFVLTTPFSIQSDLGYNKLRRYLMRVSHQGAVTLKMTGVKDGQESGLPITRALAVTDIGVVNAPLNDAGSDFQLKVELSAFDAQASLGNSQVFIVPRRRFRA